MKIKGETYARRKFANYARSYGRFDVLHEPVAKETVPKRMESLNKLQKEMKSSRLVACTEPSMKSIQTARPSCLG